MSALICFAVLAIVMYMLVEVWSASVCLGVGLLVIAVSVFGLRKVVCSPIQTSGQTVGFIEQRYGAMMVLALLFAMFAVGLAAWTIFGGH